MAVRREQVYIALEPTELRSVRARAAEVAKRFGADMDRRRLNTHRLDRIDRFQFGDPHRWPGDDS